MNGSHLSAPSSQTYEPVGHRPHRLDELWAVYLHGRRVPLLARVLHLEESRVGLHVTILHQLGEYELYAWADVEFLHSVNNDRTFATGGLDSIVPSVPAFIAKAIRGARRTGDDKRRAAANDLYDAGLTDEQIMAERDDWSGDPEETP